MNEEFPKINVLEQKEKSPDSLFKKWLNGPVILASTSLYRRERLIDAGFREEKITQLGTSDEEEKKAMENHLDYINKQKGEMCSGLDQMVPQKVAINKVQTVLRDESIPSEALVIAADTVTYRYKGEGFAFASESVPNTKQSDPEQARSLINEILLQIAHEYIDTWFLAHTGHLWNRHGIIDASVDPMTYRTHLDTGIFQNEKLKITVVTGVAVRLPNITGTIYSFGELLDLYPTAVFSIMENCLKNNSIKKIDKIDKKKVMDAVTPMIEDLTDQVVALHPELVTRVAGAIPLHDIGVQKILGLSTFNPNGDLVSNFKLNDDGVLKGLSAESLVRELKKLAQNLEKI